MRGAPAIGHSRILIISPDQRTHMLFEKALSLLGQPDRIPREGEEETFSPEAPSLMVHVECKEGDALSAGRQALLEAEKVSQPISMVILDGVETQLEKVWSMMQSSWQDDSSICFVICLPADPQCLVPSIPSRRTGNWMVLRKPFYEEDINLVFACLGKRGGYKDGAPLQFGTVQSGGLKDPAKAPQGNGSKEKDEELELARDELASSKSYVNNILRSMADSLFVITMDMTIGAVNPSLLTLLSYREEELIGESPGRIFGEEFARGVIMEALMLQGTVSGVESSFLTRDGRRIPISVSGSLMKDERGQFQGMVCVAQDISERKRMEEETKQLHERLLETSRQLGMAEVATGVLHNVGNLLNSVNVSVGIMVDVMNQTMVGDVNRISQMFEKHHHDLGAFLTDHPKGKQIPGYVKQLSEQLLKEQHQILSELERVRDNIGRAQQCVAAQQEVSKPNGISGPFWLSDVVEEALVMNRQILEKESISVVREYDELPQVVFDKHPILQIVVSLIRNACQAMETVPEKRLVLRIKQVIGPPDSVRLEVQDSGVGIPPEDLIRIFNQGYTTKPIGGGMNLHSGAIVVKNLGGELTALSEGLGKGATLVLDLPGHFHFPEL